MSRRRSSAASAVCTRMRCSPGNRRNCIPSQSKAREKAVCPTRQRSSSHIIPKTSGSRNCGPSTAPRKTATFTGSPPGYRSTAAHTPEPSMSPPSTASTSSVSQPVRTDSPGNGASSRPRRASSQRRKIAGRSNFAASSRVPISRSKISRSRARTTSSVPAASAASRDSKSRRSASCQRGGWAM